MDVPESSSPELVPRNYQDELIRICVKQNSIIFLPTGAGKTFTALCAIKQLVGDDFARTYSEGGKLCVFLVNTVTLVAQHKKYMEQNTPYTIGAYTGDMNLDYWSREQWLHEYNTHNVIIMTSQILKNSLTTGFLDLNKVNVMIFDECHHGVDNHPMRDIMLYFKNLTDPPRVIGLTATLLNGNVKPNMVLEEVRKLETTFHAKVASVDALINVVGYSTNPKEEIIEYRSPSIHPVIKEACDNLAALEAIIRQFKASPEKAKPIKNLQYLKKEKPYEKYYKLLMDAQLHFKMFGIAGTRIACIMYMVHMQLEKRSCSEAKTLAVINAIIDMFNQTKRKMDTVYLSSPSEQRTLLLSTNKVQKLIQTLMTFKNKSKQELCGIIFVQRKNTAMLLYHILNEVKKTYDEMDFIKPDFIIGNTANPLNSTIESLYYAKLNKKVMDRFNSKEVNLLIASNVIEEGVDVQMCSIVIKFDIVQDYRAYIQSKGRARHAASLYYIMVEATERAQFTNKYLTFQSIESGLNNYLIGSNDHRKMPDQSRINAMYEEKKIFYVDGPGSANISESMAMSLLMMYCNSTKTDMYTKYEPVFYVEGNIDKCRVYIQMPTFCPLKDLIPGEWKSSKKEAKNSAAYMTCIKLYQVGELSAEMLPAPATLSKENLGFLFTHWPENGNKRDGVSKKTRSYIRRIPKVLSAPIESGKRVFLHIINMTPLLGAEHAILNNLYSNDLCFGIITSEKLPNLCEFPTFVTLGQISVKLDVNQNNFVFSAQQVSLIKRFHHVIFDGVLDILSSKSYLMLGDNRPMYSYIVPVLKSTKSIDFNIIMDHEDIVDVSNVLTNEEKQSLVVNNETYLEKIVTPDYRERNRHHLVMEVCEYITAASPFPNSEFQSYADYYECKYDRVLVNCNLPMLSVKPLSSNMNCHKPRGLATKRKREETFEMFVQHFSPELCVKQTLPAQLWVSATLLPSIMHRIHQLLIADELRTLIAKQANLGSCTVMNWVPLKVDSRVINYKSNVADESLRKNDSLFDENMPTEMKAQEISDMITKFTPGDHIVDASINKTFNDVMIDAQYPWEAEVEPIDCYRNLDVTLGDIELFAKFINTRYETAPNANPTPMIQNNGCLAINYTPPEYQYKSIGLLSEKSTNHKGPELCSVYEALTTAKAHDIVNLERLETLGDSFLKMAASLYVFNKFPHFSEGQATELKGKLVSNRNLFYLAQKHGIGGLIVNSEFNPKDEWLPPGYCTPVEVQEMILRQDASIACLFEIDIPRDEQISGELSDATFELIQDRREDIEEDETQDNGYASMCHYIGRQVIGDKTLADVIESIIGIYVGAMGINGGMKILEWLRIIPEDAIKATFGATIPNPIIKENCTQRDITAQLSNYEASQVEKILDYNFRNRAFLLQALTHSSYNGNHITQSYQRLEFIGDAVLDLLITLFIFENNTQLNPGDLTDLRSALVNNETFAAYIIKLGLHKYLKHYNTKLTSLIAKFESFQNMRKNEITGDVLLLLDEDNLHLAENVDVPKVLGDLFESIMGAIFLDSGMDLLTVWRVIHKIMWREFDSFSKDIPKNPIRMLHETLAPLRPKFSDPVDVDQGSRTMIKLDFNLQGTLTRVHGFGDNKTNAKKAAAKVALRLLSVKKK